MRSSVDQPSSKLTMLDLFSGTGAFSLAAHQHGIDTVAFCECEPYPQRILARHFPDVPVFPDVKELTADDVAHACRDGAKRRGESRGLAGEAGRAQSKAGSVIRDATDDSGEDSADSGDVHAERKQGGTVDIICGGFPCQDLSYAGKGAGLEGDTRSGLYREVVRLAGDLRPRWILLENVAALLARGLDVVLGDFAALGYDALWAAVPACAVGAPHRRDRVWIVLTNTDADLEAMYARVLSRLTPFGSERWPTATASDAWANGLDREGMSGKHNLGLGTAARINSTWPTPTSRAHKEGGYCENVPVNSLLGRSVWPTPRAAEHGGALCGGSGHYAMMAAHYEGDELRALTSNRSDSFDSGTTGSLNPDWVECALMGLPQGYTEPTGEPIPWMHDKWGAGLGAPQHEWEPPRLTTVKENRAARLKALGNGIVPQVASLWFEAIVHREVMLSV